MKSLNKVFGYDARTQTAIWRGMKTAAKPLEKTLKQLIRKDAKDTGRLARSIKIFRAKRLDKYKRPSAFVGPRIKAPKTKKYKDPETAQAWYDKWSGYYFYFLEYGFRPWGKKLISGLGLRPKTVQMAGSQTEALLKDAIMKELMKNIEKQGLK